MDLERVIAALAPTDVVGRAPAEVRDLAFDVRTVRPGALFFCVPGSRADGHDFAPEAVERGAVALVVEHPVDAAVPQLVVPSSRAAMAVVADEFFGRPTEELEVVGVTGTNGKTTTAFLLHSILDAADRRPGLIGTVEARVGGVPRKLERTTPEAIDLQRLFREMLDAGDRSCAMEASSHASELHRLDRMRFRALIFTNLTQDHLDFHGTMERYYAAKRRLFGEAPAVVNVDDPWGRRLVQELGGAAVTFGLSPEAQVGPEALAGIDLRLRGRFNVLNALGAAAAARLLGVDDAALRAGLEAVEGVPGRFEEVSEGQPFTVLVDYSHTPDSLDNALRAAGALADGRLICVFGCGGDRDREKRPLMGRVATELADLAIVTSDNPRSEDPGRIIAEVVAGATGEVVVEPDRRAAIELAVEAAEPGDVMLVAGKGHEQGQEIGEVVLPFDDREVAREALRKLAGARA
ncbi:MAG TPA: UDP-N-acetylmuramoyl-L-alanyl-D-glutamate--2,6-diaminopimelate ligase [Gaiellaceae bacterium]|jgi:UDP-N-acetylmuramoyl-L-alanyl-D-glutamate--2,6-diaminopimelate ligase|nr:UDP-N-acetylmuramoyl-L-alanyl-D-glutamate--2,6-diaminopimelate ligase [Gaiellaceae bacterium]